MIIKEDEHIIDQSVKCIVGMLQQMDTPNHASMVGIAISHTIIANIMTWSKPECRDVFIQSSLKTLDESLQQVKTYLTEQGL